MFPLFKIASFSKSGGTLYTMPHPPGGAHLPDAAMFLQNRGINVVLSLLTTAENKVLGLEDEDIFLAKANIHFLWHQIEDFSTPSSLEDAAHSCSVCMTWLEKGYDLAIHCRAGIGRSSLMAACLLVYNGKTAREAYQTISEARGLPVPETAGQMAWTEAFETFLGNPNPNPTQER